MPQFTADTPLRAWGVTKKVADWARSPQCQVDVDELVRRLTAGLDAEVAITSPMLPPAKEPPPLSKIPFAERPAAPPPRKSNKKRHSQYLGVSKRAGQWYAQIRAGFKVKFLGEHPNEIAAALAYDVEARKLGKPLNFPDKPNAAR